MPFELIPFSLWFSGIFKSCNNLFKFSAIRALQKIFIGLSVAICISSDHFLILLEERWKSSSNHIWAMGLNNFWNCVHIFLQLIAFSREIFMHLKMNISRIWTQVYYVMMFPKRFYLVVLQSFTTCSVNRAVGTWWCKGDIRPHPKFQQKKSKTCSIKWAYITAFLKYSDLPTALVKLNIEIFRSAKKFLSIFLAGFFFMFSILPWLWIRDRRYSVYTYLNQTWTQPFLYFVLCF